MKSALTRAQLAQLAELNAEAVHRDAVMQALRIGACVLVMVVALLFLVIAWVG